MFFAFLARLIGLNQSLWLDEGTSAKVVLKYTLFDIPTKFSVLDFHPPLYYFFMKLWTAFLGYSEFALREPSVIFSLLTGYYVFLIVKKMRDEKTALWATAFFLFNPLIMYYSQEARMYMMATFFLTAAYYYQFIKRDFLKQNLYAALSFGTFYGSAFFLAGMYGYLILIKDWKTLRKSVIGFFLSILILSPLLFFQLENAKRALGLVPNWHQVLGSASLKNLFLIPLKFSFGRISFYPKSLYLILSGLWTFIVFISALLGFRKNFRMGFVFLIPLLLGLIFSFFTPLLQYFRFLYLLPFLSILVAVSAENKFVRSIVLTGFIVLSFFYLLFPQNHREDWRTLAFNLDSRTPIYGIVPSLDALQYYSAGMSINDLRSLSLTKINFSEIMVIPYTADIYGLDYHRLLQNQAYALKYKKTVRGLEYEAWVKKKPSSSGVADTP